MDNNFNQQVPQNQQPVYQQQIPQQPVYQQQAPQQPVYQQPAPQQPVYQQPAPQQPVYQQQAPQQPVYQQPVYQQQAPQQPVYQQAPQKPKSSSAPGVLALIVSGVGAFLAILGSILTCSCSASKSYDAERVAKDALSMLSGSSLDIHVMSLVWLVAFFGAIIAAVGVVLAILDIKKHGKQAKLAYIALAVGGFGFMYGMLSFLTICGYNCSLNSSSEEALSSSLGSLF